MRGGGRSLPQRTPSFTELGQSGVLLHDWRGLAAVGLSYAPTMQL